MLVAQFRPSPTNQRLTQCPAQHKYLRGLSQKYWQKFTEQGLSKGPDQRYTEITHNTTLLFSVAQGIFWLSTLSRSTLHLKKRGEERGVCTLVLFSLVTVMSWIDPLRADSDKTPEGRTSTYILHLSVGDTSAKKVSAPSKSLDFGKGPFKRGPKSLCPL